MPIDRDALRDKKHMAKNPPPAYVCMPEGSGDIEADSAADLDAVQAGFRARAKRDADRKRLATDSEFWACLCFQTRAQKEAFLAALNLLQLGDKYIDGIDAAKVLGVPLPAGGPPYHDVTKADPTWASLVIDRRK
jgi:hypothetical protein